MKKDKNGNKNDKPNDLTKPETTEDALRRGDKLSELLIDWVLDVERGDKES